MTTDRTTEQPRLTRTLVTLVSLGVVSYGAAGTALYGLWLDEDGAATVLLSGVTLFVLVCWTAGVARLYTRLRGGTATVLANATVQPSTSAANVRAHHRSSSG